MDFLEPLEDGHVKHELMLEETHDVNYDLDFVFPLYNTQANNNFLPNMEHLMTLDDSSLGDHSLTTSVPGFKTTDDYYSLEAKTSLPPTKKLSTGKSSVSKPPQPPIRGLSSPNSKSGNALSACSVTSLPKVQPQDAKRSREEAVRRFREKRALRCYKKKVRYECRKRIAATRPRVSGRFAKKSDLERNISIGSNLSDVTATCSD